MRFEKMDTTVVKHLARNDKPFIYSAYRGHTKDLIWRVNCIPFMASSRQLLRWQAAFRFANELNVRLARKRRKNVN